MTEPSFICATSCGIEASAGGWLLRAPGTPATTLPLL
ncbi:Uncharacterised protein [Vibrio cholerae]|nr:Uncharacterised protein [Vibrio cholerae]